jgi:hypothetical protein
MARRAHIASAMASICLMFDVSSLFVSTSISTASSARAKLLRDRRIAAAIFDLEISYMSDQLIAFGVELERISVDI